MVNWDSALTFHASERTTCVRCLIGINACCQQWWRVLRYIST